MEIGREEEREREFAELGGTNALAVDLMDFREKDCSDSRLWSIFSLVGDAETAGGWTLGRRGCFARLILQQSYDKKNERERERRGGNVKERKRNVESSAAWRVSRGELDSLAT